MAKRVEKEPTIMHQVTNILENGVKIKRMEMGFYNIKMELSMMVNGLMINLKTKGKLNRQHNLRKRIKNLSKYK